ncbi:protoporphyrinogen oxidase HemJ [Aestuariibacter halophilus]|uniref:Protoporphyrinogen IX oxidase n=1 Tax=Fluctibacter halophilus TaxID=226011 RepID=A0ABS8GA52_9ALTE|nr:protoporphyrinogen oxidase HemJ [Aestuariibacter halophilus]MCC2617459.1 protoporphyrinogen oxidase HemJ [Aestuariibacter halophilus]
MLWLKTLHLFFMIAWMAGIFYLPRLFVYHAESSNEAVRAQFCIMERRLWFFVTPFALLTLVFGLALIHSYGSAWLKASGWLHLKLLLVALLYVYHGYLYVLMKRFAAGTDRHSARFYRFLNESPVLLLLAIVYLAIVKPF